VHLCTSALVLLLRARRNARAFSPVSHLCPPLAHARPAQEELFIKFAEFEEKVKESERARAIFKYALDHLPKAHASDIYKRFVAFEKQHGDREGIEDVIVSERRFAYEDDVKLRHLVRLRAAGGERRRRRQSARGAAAGRWDKRLGWGAPARLQSEAGRVSGSGK
jgi:Suppressor of forked protein (Suf)